MSATATLGNVDEDTRTIAREVIDYLESIGDEMPPYADYPSGVMWGLGSSSEHATGWAIDFMIRNDSSTGNRIAAFLWDNRVRFGMRHQIWRQRIKSTVQSPGVWRSMGDRGSPTENHMDHIHALFNGQDFPRHYYGGDGGTQNVPFEPELELEERFWTPPVDRTVRSIQDIVGVPVDGLYGLTTGDAVEVFQRSLGVEADGFWGPETDAAYEATKVDEPTYWLPTGEFTTKKIQGVVGVKADGLYGSSTRAAVVKMQRALGVKADGFWGPKTEDAYERTRSQKKAPGFPLPNGWYFGPKSGPRESVSGYYGHRAGLRRWQEKMMGRGWSFAPHGADGRYGDTTAQVVQQFQKEKGLPVDGLIGAKTWTATWMEDVT